MKRRYVWAACGCAFAALAACSVGPAYKRPDFAAPAKWHDAFADGDTAVWPTPDWWHGFGSAKLDELITEAEHSNDDLAVAVARVQEADAQARIAGAPLLPSLDLGATAIRERAQVSSLGPRAFNVFSPELTASYELDFWGKNRAARAAARATAVASRFDQQTVALTVISSVATTYFQTLELRDRIEVARQNLENGRTVLDGLRLQETAGIATDSMWHSRRPPWPCWMRRYRPCCSSFVRP
jgi:multidrug efflux system outer membrane protein